jgi:hypothetical protein
VRAFLDVLTGQFSDGTWHARMANHIEQSRR